MDTNLKMKLEKAIDKWMSSAIDKSEFPDMYLTDSLHVHMANAAAAVFDSCFDGQQIVEEHKP